MFGVGAFWLDELGVVVGELSKKTGALGSDEAGRNGDWGVIVVVLPLGLDETVPGDDELKKFGAFGSLEAV